MDSRRLQNRALARTNAAPSFNDFTRSLWITHDPTSEIINIRFVDTDAQTARATVQSLIESYRKLAEQTADSNPERLDVSSQTIRLARQSIQSSQARIDSLVKNHGTEDLTLFVQTWVSTMRNLDQAIQERESAPDKVYLVHRFYDQEQLQQLCDARGSRRFQHHGCSRPGRVRSRN